MSKITLQIGSSLIRLVLGDITDMEVDAVVNAANPSLMGGGGVDGAIHRKGGPKILEECKKIRTTMWHDGLPAGKAIITSGGNLKAKFVIHTVGPVWHGGERGEPEVLAQAYQNSLKLALDNKLRTVAFPSISTGAYGYPINDASRIALQTTVDFLKQKDFIYEVIFVLFSERDRKIYAEALEEIQKNTVRLLDRTLY